MFYTYTQNNSEGVMDHDPEHGIGHALCIEANSEGDAEKRLWKITGGYDQGPYCECCGPRWDHYGPCVGKIPSHFGQPLASRYGIPAYVHFLDGRIEATK